jgi:hypothetical protein
MNKKGQKMRKTVNFMAALCMLSNLLPFTGNKTAFAEEGENLVPLNKGLSFGIDYL